MLTEWLSWRWCLYVNLFFAGVRAFWWAAAIFVAGAVVVGLLFRRGPLARPEDQARVAGVAAGAAEPGPVVQ